MLSKTTLKRLNINRLALFLAIILALVFSTGFTRAWLKDQAIQKDIQALEKERRKLETNKLHLLSVLKEIKSDSFIEKEAREKFGLQKPGEKLAILVDRNKKSLGEKYQESAAESKIKESNLARWWKYFFVH